MATKLIHYKVPLEGSMYTFKNTGLQTGKPVEVTDMKMTVPNTDTIMWVNPETKQTENRAIRYMSRYQTIFVDEQVAKGAPTLEAYLDPKYRKSPSDRIPFIKGHLYVNPEGKEKAKAQYLELCNYNGTNAGRDTDRGILFILVDEAKISKKEFDNEYITYSAKKLIFELADDGEKLRKLGNILLGETSAMEDIEVQNALLNIAKKMPSAQNPISGAERILTAFKTLSIDIDEVIADAERLGVIQVLPSKVIWKGDNTTITSYKAGSAGKEKLLEFLNKPENADTYNTLKSVVKEKREEEVGTQVA